MSLDVLMPKTNKPMGFATTAEHLLAEVDHANAELRDHGALVDEFLQHASVELSDPSSAVVALAEGTAAAHGRRLGDELRHALELIAQNGRRVASLASEIGDMSRSPDIDPASAPHAVDGELLVRRAAETVRPLLSRRLLDVRVTVQPACPPRASALASRPLHAPRGAMAERSPFT